MLLQKKWYLYQNIYAVKEGAAPLKWELGEKAVKTKAVAKKLLWW